MAGNAMPDPRYSDPRPVDVDSDWFTVLRVSDHLFAITEPRHYEHTVIYLLIGDGCAILIDTGCGIGDLGNVVEQLTKFPVTVINTHTHLDHLGSSRQFSDIMMFDHPRSRDVSESGVPQADLFRELLDEKLITPPWPQGFQRENAVLPPFNVSRWLKHGDQIEIGGISLKVLHTPGEAPDHICLLDQTHRVLFSGDILLNGPVWSHLVGGDVHELHGSYELLTRFREEFDILMPSHNAPCQDNRLLPAALAITEGILSGELSPSLGVDPWGRRYKKYGSGKITILTS